MTFDFGLLGATLCMGIAAIGSAIGIGIAGQGAIGAWKRCYLNNKAAPYSFCWCSSYSDTLRIPSYFKNGWKHC